MKMNHDIELYPNDAVIIHIPDHANRDSGAAMVETKVENQFGTYHDPLTDNFSHGVVSHQTRSTHLEHVYLVEKQPETQFSEDGTISSVNHVRNYIHVEDFKTEPRDGGIFMDEDSSTFLANDFTSSDSGKAPNFITSVANCRDSGQPLGPKIKVEFAEGFSIGEQFQMVGNTYSFRSNGEQMAPRLIPEMQSLINVNVDNVDDNTPRNCNVELPGSNPGVASESGFESCYCDKFSSSNKKCRRFQTGENPLECNFCDATFTSNCSLEKHRDSHIGEAISRHQITDSVCSNVSDFKMENGPISDVSMDEVDSICSRNETNCHKDENVVQVEKNLVIPIESLGHLHYPVIKCELLENVSYGQQFEVVGSKSYSENPFHGVTSGEPSSVVENRMSCDAPGGEKLIDSSHCSTDALSVIQNEEGALHVKIEIASCDNEKSTHPEINLSTTEGRAEVNIETANFDYPTSKEPLKCKHCGAKFTCSVRLKYHERNHTEKGSQSDVKSLVKSHTGEKRFACQHCDAKFVSAYRLKSHVQRMHPGEKPFACQYCDAKFLVPHALRHHELAHTDGKLFQCRFCDDQFDTRLLLGAHERIHTRGKLFACQYCDSRFTNSKDFNRHVLSHKGDKPFNCQYCDAKFSQDFSLRLHESTHSTESTFTCLYCNAKFISAYHLKRHERLHSKVKSFPCKFCGVRFLSHRALLRHQKTHVKHVQKPLACQYCPKTFSYKADLEPHERSHRGERIFSCKYCVAKFTRATTLRHHESTHSTISTFTCKRCNASFVSAGYLKRHETLHTKSFACKFCIARFFSKHDMETHELTHVERREETYVAKLLACEYCDQEFAYESGSKHYDKTHTSKKPLICRYCTMEFKNAFDCIQCGFKVLRKPPLTNPENSESANEASLCIDCHVANNSEQGLKKESNCLALSGVHFPDANSVDNNNVSVKANLDVHIDLSRPKLIDIPDVKYPETCPYCECKFTNLSKLSLHVKNKHRNVDESSGNPILSLFKKNRLSCQHCGAQFAGLKSLRRHEKNQHINVDKNVDNPKSNDVDEKRSCQYCGLQFANLSRHVRAKHINVDNNMNNPQASHEEEKPFSCQHCGAKFTTSSGLEGHERKHTGEKPFECKLCNAKFTNRAHLRYHETKHNEETFPCRFCSAVLFSKAGWKYHEKKHLGEKPLECNFCDMKFSSSSHFKRHLRTAHTGETALKCEHCDATFSNRTELYSHSHIEDKPSS